MKKERLDILVMERGLASSRQEAQGLIIAGSVTVGGVRAVKPGTQYGSDAEINVTGERRRFVSRGGLKLEAALDRFALDVAGRSALDVGASTGGFSDCLLSRGAARVVCVDVGYGQLAEKLRTDLRVTVIDRFNARFLKPSDLPFVPGVSVIDVSFISLRHILPPVMECMEPGGDVIPLVKPQFEAGKRLVGKGGIVRDPEARGAVVAGIESFAAELGLEVLGRMTSPIEGADGNVEFLLHLRKPR